MVGGCLLLPALAPLLNHWSFRDTTVPLLFLGLALAGCVMLARHGTAPSRQPAMPIAREVAWIALAVTMPAFVLLPGWPAATGDEPHYLLAARSLVTDGDLDLAADYDEERYVPYWLGPLSPHTKPGVDPTTRYSTHGVGYPTLLAPAVAVGLVVGEARAVAVARVFQILMYGGFAILLYILIADLADRRAARLGVLAAMPLGPLLFAPLAVFPETAGMTVACATFLLLRRPDSPGRVVAGGLLVAVLPWIAIKLLFVSAALALIPIVRGSDQLSRVRLVALIATPVAVSAGCHFALTWNLYGTLSPAAICVGADPSVGRHTARGTDWLGYLADLPGAARTWLGYWFDQKDSLLAVAPHYLVGAAAIPWLMRRRRFDLLALAAIVVAHSLPYALAQELGGASPPVRPLMPVLWALAVPVGIGLTRPWRGVAGVLAGSLVAASASITIVLATNPGLLTHDYNVQMSRLLLAYSPHGSNIWRAFPLWVNYAAPNWGATLAWLKRFS